MEKKEFNTIRWSWVLLKSRFVGGSDQVVRGERITIAKQKSEN